MQRQESLWEGEQRVISYNKGAHLEGNYIEEQSVKAKLFR